MDEDSGSPERVGGLIPHFFFDLIGRIVPGAFLLLSSYVLVDPQLELLGRTKDLFKDFPFLGSAAVLLAFVAAGYFVGLLLGAISYVIEHVWARWKPLTIGNVWSRFGSSAQELARLKEVFYSEFGFSAR